MTTQKNGFVLYNNYFNQIALLSMEERGILITAIFEYTRNGHIETEMPREVLMAFSFIKDTLDRDLAAYRARCEQNIENGKKGGRPRKSFLPPKTHGFSEKPKKADNDKDKENENENEKDNEIEIEKERGKETRIDPQNASRPLRAGDDDQIGSAPSPAPRLSPAPQLSEEEQEFLKQKGVPEEYVSARLKRAAKHAQISHRPIADLLTEWWQADRTQAPWKQTTTTHAQRSPPMPLSASSFDTDDFLQAALNYSSRIMEHSLANGAAT